MFQTFSRFGKQAILPDCALNGMRKTYTLILVTQCFHMNQSSRTESRAAKHEGINRDGPAWMNLIELMGSSMALVFLGRVLVLMSGFISRFPCNNNNNETRTEHRHKLITEDGTRFIPNNRQKNQSVIPWFSMKQDSEADRWALWAAAKFFWFGSGFDWW